MNKEVNKANNVKFILGDVALKLEFLKDYQADIVTLDPPRAGLGKKMCFRCFEYWTRDDSLCFM